MVKGNLKSFELKTIDECEDRLSLARDCLNRSKDGAAEAAGVSYMLHRACEGGEPAKWLTAQIEARNIEIKKHNDDLSDLFKRAKDFMDGKLSKEDHLNKKPADEAEKQVHEAERSELRRISGLSLKEKNKMRRILVEAREGASKYTKLVKFIFQFDKDFHAGMVSRYSLALEWIGSKFDQSVDMEVDDIKKLILDNDGFEKIVLDQREINDNSEESQEQASIISKAIKAAARGKVETMGPIITVPIIPDRTKDGFGLLLFRMVEGEVSVIGDAGLTDYDIDRAVNYQGSKSPIECDPISDFVGKAVELGLVIKDGQEVKGETESGKKIYVQRCLSIKPDDNGNAQLIVSLRNADAAPILRAIPKTAQITAIGNQAFMLRTEDRKNLENEIKNPERRSLISMLPVRDPVRKDGTPAESIMAWKVSNRALADAGQDNAERSFYWREIEKIDPKPLDIDNFQPIFDGHVDNTDLSLIVDNILEPWTKDKSKEKGKHIVQITVDKDKLRITCGNYEPVVCSFKSEKPVKGSVRVRPRELHQVFTKLRNWSTDKFRLKGDDGGLFQIGWEDQIGAWDFSFPTLTRDGRLETRRIAPMRAPAMPVAAE